LATSGRKGLRKATNNEEQRKQMYTSLASSTVMGRVGTADEIAKAAVFLASNDSSYITGIELFVDGEIRQI
jgi:NAD(P)-dependent dehydrogenase (short-subunit alcohol dehydrogenase family)